MIALAVPVEVVQSVQAPADARYAAGVEARRAGRHAEAAALFESVLSERPGDADARLNLGLSLLALGRLDDADAAFAAVLQTAPDYADAEVGRARVAQRRGDNERALAAALRAQRLAPGQAEVAALVRDLQPTPWRIDVDASRSSLSAGLPDWSEQRVAVARRLSPDLRGSLAVERSERFDTVDVYVEGRLDRTLERGSAYVAIGGAFDADYRPEVALRLGGEAPLGAGFRATLDGSVARFGAGTVSSLQPGVAATLFADRLDLSARWIAVRDETGEQRDGYAAGAAFQVTDRLRLRAAYADAPETSEGVTVDVRSRSLGADVGLTDRLALRVTATAEDRGAYDRDEIAVGIGWRF